MSKKEDRVRFIKKVVLIITLISGIASLFIEGNAENYIVAFFAIMSCIFGFLEFNPFLKDPSYPPFNREEYLSFFNFLRSSVGIINLTDKDNEIEFKIDETLKLTDHIEKDFLLAKNKGDAEISGEINAIAFNGSNFEGEAKTLKERINEKIQRNYTFIQKNDLTIALLSNFSLVYRVHYAVSCILPLTKDSYDKYTSGNISDNRFSSEYVAQKNDEIHSLILFMIGGKKKGIPNKVFNDVPTMVYFMTRHLAILAKEMNLKGKTIRVIAQNKRLSIQAPLKRLGFSVNPNLMTKDEEPILEAKIKFI